MTSALPLRLIPLGMSAQKTVTVSGEYTYYTPSNITIDQAKFTALERAKNQLIADEFGTVVGVINTSMVSNVNGESEVSFLSIGESEVKGEWIETKGEPAYTISFEQNMLVGDDIVFEVRAASDHKFVDLGLSVKWATCNVGASKPVDYGDYYAWGETSTKSDYSWSTYKWCKGSNTSMTKYCTSSSYGTVDNKTVLESSDDVAHVKWGGSWRMPSASEIDELINNCDSKWTTLNGVKGSKFTSRKNGNSIFLPAAGYRNYSFLSNVGSYGNFWSSSLGGGISGNA